MSSLVRSLRVFLFCIVVLNQNGTLLAHSREQINLTYTQDDSGSKSHIPLMATTLALGVAYITSLGCVFHCASPAKLGCMFSLVSAIATVAITPFLVAWLVKDLQKDPVVQYTVKGLPYTPATLQIDSSTTFSNSLISYWKTQCEGSVQRGKSPVSSCQFKNAGKHSVVVGARDYDGDYAEHTQSVTIYDGKPNVTFTCAFEPSPYAPTVLNCWGTPTSPHPDPQLKNTWLFSGGKKALGNATGKAASHAFALPGTFSVKLVVRDRFEQVSQKDLSVTALDAMPVASPSCRLTPYPYAPTNISCRASWKSPDSSVTSITYHWNFGPLGKVHSTDGNAQVAIESAGTYTPTLQVEDSRNRLSKNAQTSLTALYAYPLVQLAVAFSNIYHSAPLNVTLDSTVSSAQYPGDYLVDVEWNIDGVKESGSMEELGVKEHLFDNAGVHQVQIRITDNRRFVSNWQTFPIAINSRNPIVSIKYTPSNDGHAPALVELDPSASQANYPNTTIVRFEWTSFFPVFDGLETHPPRGAVKEWLIYPGKYWAMVKATDSAGFSNTARVEFTLLP